MRKFLERRLVPLGAIHHPVFNDALEVGRASARREHSAGASAVRQGADAGRANGNGLEVLADETVLDELIEIARDRRYGLGWQMVVLGLARPRDERVIPILISLLDDEDVRGHAALALGKLRARDAHEALTALAEHAPKPWVRKEARSALAKIEKTK